MGNFVSTGSRASENGEPAVLGHLNGGSDDSLKENDVKMEDVNDSGPIEDCVMSEASSLLNSKQRDNFEEDEETEYEDDEEEETDDEDEDEDDEETEDEDEEEEEEEETDDEEEENRFQVGDFVWVEKVNSHKWWPGKIYDSSDASDLALKQMQRGQLLVAYSGNEKSFAWCNPLQLKPFLENFKELSKTSDSRGFLSDVEEAVREIGEHVEHLLVCDKALVRSPVAVNSGIKEGVLVPHVRRETVSSLVLEKPGIVLEDVKSLAKKAVGFSDLLEVEVLKRKISAFYRRRGGFGLAEFDEEGYIKGLERGGYEDKSSCQMRSLRKCSVTASKKRKFGDEVISKVDLDDVATTGSTTLRRRLSGVSNGKRKNRRCLDDDDDGGTERREESNDSNQLEESDEKKQDSCVEIAIDLSTPLASLCKRVKVDVSPIAEKNSVLQTGKRERKKSKYLSPEYMTDFGLRERRIKIESESSQIRVTERMTKNTAEKAMNFVRFGATPEEMLKLIREAALGTQYLKEYSSSSDMIREFVSIYRSFTYHDGKRNISDEEKQQVVDETVEKSKREVDKEFSGVELFIKTSVGSTLPSKDDLIQIYKKFGALEEGRSYMFENNSSARVAFLNVSDGQEAFYKSLEKCPFATASTSTVTFKLIYPCSGSPNEKNEDESRARKGVMEVECLKEKLEEMRALLDQSEGEITEELKMKLVDGSRNLLDKVSKMIVRSS